MLVPALVPITAAPRNPIPNSKATSIGPPPDIVPEAIPYPNPKHRRARTGDGRMTRSLRPKSRRAGTDRTRNPPTKAVKISAGNQS